MPVFASKLTVMQEISESMSSPTERVLPVPFLLKENEPHSEVRADQGLEQWDDVRLLESLKTGRQEALAEAFRRYSRLVMSIALRILRDEGEAEEIVHEVFLFLFERASDFEQNKGDAKGWVVQLAYHRSLDRRRYLRRRQIFLGTDDQAVSDTLTETFDLDKHVTSKESRQRLKEAFQALSEKQRRTLEMFFFEDLDFDEIAERLGESFDNIRHHYYRGLQNLRKDAQIKKLRDNQKS